MVDLPAASLPTLSLAAFAVADWPAASLPTLDLAVLVAADHKGWLAEPEQG